MESGTVGGLVERARAGDEGAWTGLVERYAGLVHAVCRCFGLDDAEAEGVNQVVWLRTAEHLARFRSPEAVGGWVAAVARSESLRVVRARGRILHLGDAVDVVDVGEDPGDPDAGPSALVPVVPAATTGTDATAGAATGADAGTATATGADVDGGAERPQASTLLAALGRLDPAGQRLLRLLAVRPRPADDEIGAALDLPVDAVGPARERSLARLRRAVDAPGGAP